MSQQRGAARTWFTYSRDETQQKLLEVEAIGENLGGAFILTPIRQRVMICPECGQEVCDHLANGAEAVGANDPSGRPLFFTAGWIFKHEAFMPAVDPSRGRPPPGPADAAAELEELQRQAAALPSGETVATEVPPSGDPVYAAEPEAEVERDATEGLTPQEIEANRAHRAAQAAGEAPGLADSVVSAGGDGAQ